MKFARISLIVALCLAALQAVTSSQGHTRGPDTLAQNRVGQRHQIARLLDPFGLWGHASQAVRGARRTLQEGANRVQQMVDRGSDNFRSLQSKLGAGFRSIEKMATKAGDEKINSNQPLELLKSQQPSGEKKWHFNGLNHQVDFESSTSSATVNYLRQASDVEKPSSTWSMDQLPSTLSPHNPADHPMMEDDPSVLRSLGNIAQQLVEGDKPRKTNSNNNIKNNDNNNNYNDNNNNDNNYNNNINNDSKFERKIGEVDTKSSAEKEESGGGWLFGGLMERMGVDLPTIGVVLGNVILFVVEALIARLAEDGGQSSRALKEEGGTGGRGMQHDDQEWSLAALVRDSALADRTIQLLQHASGDSTPCLQMLLCGLQPAVSGLQRALLPPSDSMRDAVEGEASLTERVIHQLPPAGQVARALDSCAEQYPACH